MQHKHSHRWASSAGGYCNSAGAAMGFRVTAVFFFPIAQQWPCSFSNLWAAFGSLYKCQSSGFQSTFKSFSGQHRSLRWESLLPALCLLWHIPARSAHLFCCLMKQTYSTSKIYYILSFYYSVLLPVCLHENKIRISEKWILYFGGFIKHNNLILTIKIKTNDGCSMLPQGF